MRLHRFLVAAAVSMSLIGNLDAVAVRSPEVITVGQSQVNAVRLLARIKPENLTGEGRARANAVIEQTGLQVRRDFSLVPGLLYLEMTGPRANLSVVISPESRAETLLNTLQKLRESGYFTYAEPDYVVTANETASDARLLDGTLWGLLNTGQDGGVEGADINALRAWSVTAGSPDVVVASIDTGVRYDHVDLRDNMWVNPGEIPGNGIDDDNNGVVDDVYGYNAVAGNGDPFDDNSHGTHTSGTIAATGNNGYPHIGVAWKSRIMACKFLRAEGFGFDGDAIDSLNYAVKMGARISNNSWGGGDFAQAMSDAINAAGGKGHLFVASAGNSGTDNDSLPQYPASYQLDNIISVAAINRKDELADFSCFGRNSVHLGAPGVDIYSAINESAQSYASFSGTSMAAPHVSGVAALIRSKYPTAPLPEIRERIVSTVTVTPALRGTTRSGGRVDAYAALTAEADGILDLTMDPAPGTKILIGTTPVFTVRISDIALVTTATDVLGDVLYPDGSTGSAPFLDDGKKNPDQFSKDGLYTTRIPVKTNVGTMRLTVFAKAPGKKEPTNNVFRYLIVGPPANDAFAKSEKLPSTGGSVRNTLDFTSREVSEPNHAGEPNLGGSVWYSWAPIISGTGMLDNYGSSARTVVSVYTGSQLNQLTPVGSITNDPGKRTGAMVFKVVAGETYRIAVSGRSASETGEYRLRVVPNGVPDHTAPIAVVTSPLNAISTTASSIVMSGTATDLGVAPSGVKSVLVRLNGGLSTPATGTATWGLKLDLQRGNNNIEVRAMDLAENISDPVRLSIDYRPVTVSNDNLVGAQALTGTNGTVTLNTDGATREEGEPNHAGNRGGRSVWYSYQNSSAGILTLTTADSSYDTMLAVYTGSLYSDLKAVGANDDASKTVKTSRLVVSVAPGVVYKIAVDGFAGDSGSLKLGYKFEKTTAYAVNFTSTAGGVVDNSGGSFPPGTALSVLAVPAADMQFVQWRGGVVSYQNPLNLVVSKDASVEAVFAPIRITDDFEGGSLNPAIWKTSGAAPWLIQSDTASRGHAAARSGAIGDSKESILSYEGAMRAGTGSFDVRVSSEEGWDLLEFSVDGQVLGTWSGEVAWESFYFNVADGKHKLVWRYSKDAGRASGRDAAFIDSVFLPVRAPVGSNSKPSISVAEIAAGVKYYRIDGQLDQVYVLEGTQDFKQWSPVSTNANESGFIITPDPRAGTLPYRFYRATTAPAP